MCVGFPGLPQSRTTCTLTGIFGIAAFLQLEWFRAIAGGVESGSQTIGVLRDNQLFVGRDNQSRAGAFFVDEARLAETGSGLRS